MELGEKSSSFGLVWEKKVRRAAANAALQSPAIRLLFSNTLAGRRLGGGSGQGAEGQPTCLRLAGALASL